MLYSWSGTVLLTTPRRSRQGFPVATRFSVSFPCGFFATALERILSQVLCSLHRLKRLAQPPEYSYLQPCFVSVVTPFLLPRQCLLHPSQLLAKLLKVLGIDNLVTIAGGNQAGYAHIQTDFFVGFWQVGNISIDQQGCKPTTTSVKFDSNK
jgi:hypothetical protein